MTKAEFYKDKAVVETQWWLHSCELPNLIWGRLRVFSDGTADACFEEGGKLFGFENRRYASYILSEDEYVRLETIDKQEEKEYRIQLAGITQPRWQDTTEQEFEYLGTY